MILTDGTSAMVKYSKPTEYRNITFRSRLEADFARWFDSMGILWEFEPEGYKLENGLSYLPDFFLPAQRAYFECKGVMLREDEDKILQLAAESKTDVVIGMQIFNGKPLLSMVDAFNDDYWMIRGGIKVAKCLRCGKVYFMTDCGSWECRICGAYEGNGHFEEVFYSDSWGY